MLLAQISAAKAIEYHHRALDTGLLQHLRNRRHRPYTHHFRGDTGHGESDEACQRLQIVGLDGLLARQQHGGGAIARL